MNTRTPRSANIILLAFPFVFLFVCSARALLTDFKMYHWQSFWTRLALVALAGLILAWRIRQLRGVHDTTSRLRFSLCLAFACFLFFPLFSQPSFLGKSLTSVSTSLWQSTPAGTSRLLHAIRQFPATYEQHFTRNLYLPKWLIHLNAMIKVHLLGFSPNNNVAIGSNGFYYEGMGANRVEAEMVETFDNIADYMGQIPFSEHELLQWKIALEQRRYWLQSIGSEYVFVLAPTKAFVYPEHLPKRIQQVRGHTRYEQLSQYLHDYADIHFVDVLPPLLAAKTEKNYPLLFYKTDFHWNFYGAFVAYKAIVDHLARFYPDAAIGSPSLDDFEMKINTTWAHPRFLDMVGLPVNLHRNEHHITMVPKPGGLYDTAKDLPAAGIYDMYPKAKPLSASDKQSPNVRLIRNPAAPLPSIVLLGDSFMEKCYLFFSANAKRVLNYRTVVNFPKEIFHYENPTLVIQEILNMYILRPPPDNPGQITVDYFQNKFDKHPDKVLLKGSFSSMQAGQEQTITFDLAKLPPRKQGEMRTAKLTIQSPAQTELTLSFTSASTTKQETRPCRTTADKSACYFDLPYEPMTSLIIQPPSGHQALMTPASLEIRSDASWQ